MPLSANVIDRVVQKIAYNLGRTGDTIVADLTMDWLNRFQQEFCNRNNFWFMHATATDTWNQGDLSKNLPTGFKDEDNVFLSQAGTTGFTELVSMDLEDYRKRYDDTTQAQPEAYLIQPDLGTYLVRSVPDKTYTITFVYWKYLTDLVAGGTANNFITNYEDLYEAAGTMRGFRYLQEFDDAGQWEQKLERLYRDLVAENAERELPDEWGLSARPDAKGTTIGFFKGRSR